MYTALKRYDFLSVDYKALENSAGYLFENIQEAVVILSSAGIVVQSNKIADSLLGPDITKDYIKLHMSGYEFNKSYNNHKFTLKSMGAPKTVLVSQSAIQESINKTGCLLVIRDITRQIEVEIEHKNIRHRIQQAEKMEAIGQLAGGVAHDFNNQLTGITGYAELLIDLSNGKKDLIEYANQIITITRRSAALTSQLLAFARKGKYLNMPVNLHKTIGEVVSLLKHSIDKRIIIKQNLKAHSPETMGDPSQLQNALLNLTLNARDAMPQGGELLIATEVIELQEEAFKDNRFIYEPGSYICVSITDTGEGMTRDIQKRIFEPFFTTKPINKGTGMGLAAVYGTVKNHKGIIDVTSSPNHGTEFKIYLPLVSDVSPLKSPASADTGEWVVGVGKILLVDDENEVLEITSKLLNQLGYETVPFDNGEAALDYYQVAWQNISLAILDLAMPGLSGADTFRAIKQINPEARTLICSGYSLDGEAEDLLKDGAQGFIQKPFRKSQLSRKVAEMLLDKK